jgi:hypothetical protein
VSGVARTPASVSSRAAWIASTVLLALMLATILAAVAHAGEPEADVVRLTGRILGETPTMNDLRELTDAGADLLCESPRALAACLGRLGS